MRSVPTPKQSQPERLKDWYPYYAGFTNAFVDAALSHHFADANSLIDPWNGSGTTTVVAAERGVTSTGLDVNPAVTVIARARLTPVSVADSLKPLANEIIVAAGRERPVDRDCEPLETWLRGPAVRTLRELQHGINTVLVGDPELEHDLAHDADRRVESLPTLAAFYFAALFATARDLLVPFRGSNPTWLLYPETHRNRINPSAEVITATFVQRVEYLSERLRLTSPASAKRSTVKTASVLSLDCEDAFDACFTSPPYATRVDYVRGTLAELSILGLSDTHLEDLRRRTTGTPSVRGIERRSEPLRSTRANRTISQVSGHGSHGSANYYGPWIRNYLTDLEDSLARVERAVRADGPIGLVVQDSFYKSIPINLQSIVTQTMQDLGRELRSREDYQVRHSLAKMNPAARKHLAKRTNRESLLVFV